MNTAVKTFAVSINPAISIPIPDQSSFCMAMELRLADAMAAEAAQVRRARARVDALGIKNGAKSPPASHVEVEERQVRRRAAWQATVDARLAERAAKMRAMLKKRGPMTQRQIADAFDVSREVAGRAMNEMAAAGEVEVIRQKRKTVAGARFTVQYAYRDGKL